jgi:hypothetical protein
MSRRVVVMVIASICLLASAASAEVQRLYVLDDERRAQLWINHDRAQSDGQRYAPAYYE